MLGQLLKRKADEGVRVAMLVWDDRTYVVNFVGGPDLCDGRYDSAYHTVFRTLHYTHHDNFHQPNYTSASIAKGGPRESWHDIHSRLEGPITLDVLFNFEQRWRKQGILESGYVQAMLDRQRRTMEMMYKDIVKVLQSKGLDDDPKKYLTFFWKPRSDGNRRI
ncbi:hypothetical protein L1987_47577 [Smallanthus sonchifolius]|uniref:Uncharacterized protein n=1 Tax=Smallanthus sonchifolius TaxID=185202 RepID=A0ACB9G3Y2_9ASTR|nr:hypothetical protein L1987_47577 [Smallanthus sonchifolius]